MPQPASDWACLLRAVDACGDPGFVVDDQLTVVAWNHAAEAAFEVVAGNVLGRPCFEVMGGRTSTGRPLCQPRCEKWALARRGASIHNFDICALPEQDVWLNVSVLPISDAANRVVALAHIVRNINRPKRLERYVQDLAASAAEVLAVRPGNHVKPEPAPVYLTTRELAVLRLVAHGADTASIADTLGISRHTAHNHVAAVLGKLSVHSRIEAAAYAFEHHLA